MLVVVPMYKLNQNVDGFILTEEAIGSLLDRFTTFQKKIPCYNANKEKIGELHTMKYNQHEKILYFHVELDKQYTQLKSRIETYCEVTSLHVI